MTDSLDYDQMGHLKINKRSLHATRDIQADILEHDYVDYHKVTEQKLQAIKELQAEIFQHERAGNKLRANLTALIEQFSSVKNENVSLKTKQDELVKEKAKLLEKTTTARTRVESMITRLKSMEHST